MSSDSPSPSQSISPTTSTPLCKRKKRQAVPSDHKDVLKYIMFHEDGGKLNKTYQKGLKKKTGNSMSSFWQIVTNKLNTAVHPEATYTKEVMICRI